MNDPTTLTNQIKAIFRDKNTENLNSNYDKLPTKLAP